MSTEAVSTLRSEDRLAPELTNLASSHAAVADAISRMVHAISTGREIGVEQLRLQVAIDQYRTWATEVREGLEASSKDTSDVRLRLAEMQREFRAALRAKAAELAAHDQVPPADEDCSEGRQPEVSEEDGR